MYNITLLSVYAAIQHLIRPVKHTRRTKVGPGCEKYIWRGLVLTRERDHCHFNTTILIFNFFFSFFECHPKFFIRQKQETKSQTKVIDQTFESSLCLKFSFNQSRPIHVSIFHFCYSFDPDKNFFFAHLLYVLQSISFQ